MLLLSKFKAEGHSMFPYLVDGQNVFVSYIPYLFNSIKVGDVVVFKKDGSKFIKRITKIKDRRYFVEGDNKKDSLDSRRFGFIKNKDIIGKVIYKL